VNRWAKGGVVVQIYREQEHASLWDSIVSTIAGEHLSRRQRALRPIMLLMVFALLAVPILVDWLH
jgi:hypothetical protein